MVEGAGFCRCWLCPVRMFPSSVWMWQQQTGRGGETDQTNGFFSLLSVFLFSDEGSIYSLCSATAVNLCVEQKARPLLPFFGTNRLRLRRAQKRKGEGETTWGNDKKKVLYCEPTMTLWEDPWSLFIFIYSPSSLSFCFYFHTFSSLVTFGRFFLRKGYVTRGLQDGPSRHP